MQFMALFGSILRLRNILQSFDDFVADQLLSDREVQDYTSVYLDLYADHRVTRDAEKESIVDDVVFEIELVKQVEINVDYVLMLVEQHRKAKGWVMAMTRRSVRRSSGRSTPVRRCGTSSVQIELTLFFGMLAAQLRYLPDRPPQGGMQTADNTEVHVWLIDSARSTFTVTTGGYVRNLSGGWDLSDESVRIPKPLETRVDLFGARPLDDGLATDALVFMATAQRPQFETSLHWVAGPGETAHQPPHQIVLSFSRRPVRRTLGSYARMRCRSVRS